MKCQFCGYEAPRKEFPLEMSVIWTTGSGAKPRICPECKNHTYLSLEEYKVEDEVEIKELHTQIQHLLDAGDFKDIPRLRKQMKLFNDRSLSLEWVKEFLAYIEARMKEAEAPKDSPQ